jgi:hypothetical protein
MKYIITESQLKKITNLVLKEQGNQVQKSPTQTTGVVINNVTYRLPKIKNEQDLNTFTSSVPIEQLSSVVGQGRISEFPVLPRNDKETPEQMMGIRLMRSLPEFLRVHAITGKQQPMDLATLKKTIDSLSTNPTIKPYLTYSPSFLATLMTPTSRIAGDSKNIQTYYQNLLKQRMG